MSILQIMDEDPQQLIDQQTVISFNEVAHRAILVDGVAAGGAYFGFKFLDGPHEGKTIYCCRMGYPGDVPTYSYAVNDSSDGMRFNVDPALKPVDEDWGGDYLSDLDGLSLTIKESV